MKKNKDIVKFQKNDGIWLMPVRQGIQDGVRGIQLNEFSCFLWDHLEEYDSVGELVDYCRSNINIDDEDAESLKEGIQQFISMLYGNGMLISDGLYVQNTDEIDLVIGGIHIRVKGNKNVIHPSFESFGVKGNTGPELTVHLIQSRPPITYNGKILIRSEEMIVTECDDRYVLIYLKAESVYESHIMKSGDSGIVYYLDNEYSSEQIFHCIRMIYLYTAMSKGLYAIHSVSVNDNGEAVMFSASSGTGKSTHAAIWNRVFDTEIINGDLNLVGIDHDRAVIYGIPWCGTSGIYSTETYPLKAIVLLKRGNEDHVQKLTEEQKVILVQQRMISPFWTDAAFMDSLRFTEELIRTVKVFRAYVTMEDTAAQVVKEYLDHGED